MIQFTVHVDCETAIMVLVELALQNSEVILTTLEGSEPAAFGSIVVCTSNGNFPNDCFIREIQPSDKERYGISAPDFARYAFTVFAVNAGRLRDMVNKHPQFLEELQAMGDF